MQTTLGKTLGKSLRAKSSKSLRTNSRIEAEQKRHVPRSEQFIHVVIPEVRTSLLVAEHCK